MSEPGPSSLRIPPNRGSTRVIRTFEEVEVEKTILAEGWYEELECGICSHILAAPQTLVPCGHSFCGPCAWQWLMINKRVTCPHCRMQVSSETPFVPSIVLDQIVERKLNALSEGNQKAELMQERLEKAETWNVLRASFPVESKSKSRGFEEWSRFLDLGTGEESSSRRTSRPYDGLGPPLQRERPLLSSGELTLSDLRRLDAEQQGVLRRVNVRLAPPEPGDATGSSTRPTRLQFTRTPTFAGSASPPVSRPSTLRTNSGPLGRPIAVRSQALAARQSRGRTRDDPLMVPSDSEEDLGTVR